MDEIESQKDNENDEFDLSTLDQYKTPIIIGLLTLLILLVVILSAMFGAAQVCSSVDGFLDDRFKCHLNYTQPEPQQLQPELLGQPNFSIGIQNG